MSNEENEARYPLAFDSNGNPVRVPENAVAWRVRRGGGRRGRPRNVFDAETGRQLEVPLGASIDDLIDAGCPADRYLLYPIDGEGKLIPGLIAVTEVPAGDGDESQESGPSAEANLISQLLATVKAQSETLCRALEAATSGYGPIRPHVQAPVVVEQPARDDGGFKPEQIAQFAGVAKSVLDALKVSGAGAVAEGGSG